MLSKTMLIYLGVLSCSQYICRDGFLVNEIWGSDGILLADFVSVTTQCDHKWCLFDS